MVSMDTVRIGDNAIISFTQGQGYLVADSVAYRRDGADIRGERNGFRSNTLRCICGILRNRGSITAVLRRDDNLSWNVRADGDFGDGFVAEESLSGERRSHGTQNKAQGMATLMHTCRTCDRCILFRFKSAGHGEFARIDGFGSYELFCGVACIFAFSVLCNRIFGKRHGAGGALVACVFQGYFLFADDAVFCNVPL